MDIMDLQPATEARPLILVDPSTGDDLVNDGKPIRIFVEGPDTPRMIAVDRKIQQRRLRVAQRTKKIDLDVEDIETETLERIVASITGWENIATGGKPLAYSPEAARDLCEKVPIIRDQVDMFYRDRGNFLKAASGANSKPRSK